MDKSTEQWLINSKLWCKETRICIETNNAEIEFLKLLLKNTALRIELIQQESEAFEKAIAFQEEKQKEVQLQE